MTVCPACHTRYQYYRVYENQNLLCHQCRVPFIAREYVPANGAYNAHGWQRFSQPPTGFSTNSFQTFASTTNFTSGMTFMNDTAHGGPWSNGVNGAAAPSSVHVNQVPTDRAQMEQSAQELKRKRKDEEREMRRMEKERQKKARADQKALERELLRKRREVEKLSGKDKKRHLKKHSSDSSDSDTDSDSDEDISEEEVLNHRPDSQSAPRRSSRPRRNVTYKVDVSDDEDVSPGNGETPSAKKDSQKVTESADVQTNKTPDRVSDSAKARLAELVKLKIRVNLAKSMVNKDEEKIDSIKPKPNVVDLTSDDGQVQLDNKDQKIEPGSNAKVKLTSGSFCTEDKHKMAEKGEVDEMSGSDANIHNQAGTKTERKEELEEEKEGEGEEEEEEDEETEEEEEEEAEKYVVPDPEFHDFDAHRQEKDIKAGQMWASYDDIDGLPRFYFRVKEVLSLDPFRVSISWLELQNMTADQYALKKLGFWPTCGTGFKSKGGQVLDSLNMFSHILNWEKGPKGQVMIYPKKGDIWALYRNWKPGLHVEEKSLLQEYDMVEVLSDFDKQEGVLVVHLEKLQDHKTLFKRTNVQLEIRAFELCKFSYHVPAYLLRVEESPLKEECCWELDPASVSLEDVLPGSGDSKPV
ncbi:hypothetical protein KP509_13G032100 [Ceratopteris richardii]|nr:hypothetical protein KP509_13G032100 [Ceratopteris richardii]